ncbi:hypothetical protein L1887_28769 [Cichorium endivia]|nr:hypothetical protein L1887_28769 [Cichorium endivia]
MTTTTHFHKQSRERAHFISSWIYMIASFSMFTSSVISCFMISIWNLQMGLHRDRITVARGLVVHYIGDVKSWHQSQIGRTRVVTMACRKPVHASRGCLLLLPLKTKGL